MWYFEKKSVFLLGFCLFVTGISYVFADDAASRDSFRDGAAKERENQYLAAAAAFEEAHVQADDPVLKSNALMNAARCYRKAELYGKEFDVLQGLIKTHISRINFSAVIQMFQYGIQLFLRHWPDELG